MEDDEIYAAPPEQAEVQQISSVQKLKKAFELQNKIPIQVATDGRLQNREGGSATRPQKPTLKPKPPSPGMPDLPLKLSQLKPTKKPMLPPGGSSQKLKTAPGAENAKTVTSLENAASNGDVNVTSPGLSTDNVHARQKSRTSSERSSIYPPPRRSGEDKHSGTNLTNGVNSEHISSTDKPLLSSPEGTYRMRTLPPAPSGAPPPKPSQIDINLDQWIPRGADEGCDPEEIYDDIMHEEEDIPASSVSTTRRDDKNDDLPPPPEFLTRRTTRPVSIIPDMSEDEEIRELGGKSTRLEPIDAASDDDEVYDDVAVRNDEEDDEIYQDIE